MPSLETPPPTEAVQAPVSVPAPPPIPQDVTPAPEMPPPPPQEIPAATPPIKPGIGKNIILVLLALIVVGVLGFVGIRLLSGGGESLPASDNGARVTPGEETTITYWGLWETAATMRPVLSEFEKQNPDIKVTYVAQSHQDYQERLQTAITSATSPDVVRFHSSWLPMLVSGLAPAPTTALTAAELQANFYPAAITAATLNNQVWAAPTTMEGLALFTNTAMLSTVQAGIPKDWQELRDTARLLTQRDSAGNLVQAGVALGTTSNVDHWPDIVTLMLLQNGVDPKALPADKTGEALLFYTYFNSVDKTWDATMPPSTAAFAGGKVAMMLAPSWRAIDIKALNPALQWQVSPVPQLPGANPVSLVSFWQEGVPKTSTKKAAAWRLVKFLASSQAQQILFNTASTDRGFGQAPANKTLAEQVRTNPIVGPYVEQGSFGQTFYTISLTQASITSLNERLIKYLEDAVNSLIATPANIGPVVATLQQGFNQVLSQFGLAAPAVVGQPTLTL